jgi:hypothetical protein
MLTYQIPKTENSMTNFVRHGYLLYIRKQTCSHCGAVHVYSDLNEVHVARNGADRRLFPRCKRIEPGWPVEYSNLPDDTVPVCHSCVSHFMQDSVTAPIDPLQWAETLKRKYAPAASPAKASAPSHPRNPTIDDL